MPAPPRPAALETEPRGWTPGINPLRPPPCLGFARRAAGRSGLGGVAFVFGFSLGDGLHHFRVAVESGCTWKTGCRISRRRSRTRDVALAELRGDVALRPACAVCCVSLHGAFSLKAGAPSLFFLCCAVLFSLPYLQSRRRTTFPRTRPLRSSADVVEPP